MVSVLIDLSDINRITGLSTVLANIDVDFDVKNSHHIVDAKSILGLFSIDTSKPVYLVIHTEEESIVNFVMAELREIGAISVA